MTAPDHRATARLAWTRTTLGDDSLTLEPASTDASFRSYWRTHHDGRSWIVMDSPPAQEDPRPWLAIGARLAAAGLHVPEVRAQDLLQGFLLIEDLGSRLYLDVLDEANADRLYGEAMDALLVMQTRVASDDLPPFDLQVLVSGLEVMPEWFLQRHLGHAPDCGEWDVLEAAFDLIVRNALAQPRCFVHRDFHSRNLLVTDANNPGIVDFQGALHGPVTYDLASLLRDAYIAWPNARVEGWVESHRQRLLGAGVIGEAVDRRFLLLQSTPGGTWRLRVDRLYRMARCRDRRKRRQREFRRAHEYDAQHFGALLTRVWPGRDRLLHAEGASFACLRKRRTIMSRFKRVRKSMISLPSR